MSNLDNLLDNNAQWAARVQEQRPGFFENLVRQQTPEYLWIGCSDSRVPANQIVGLDPGDIFVHRNVANLVVRAAINVNVKPAIEKPGFVNAVRSVQAPAYEKKKIEYL